MLEVLEIGLGLIIILLIKYSWKRSENPLFCCLLVYSIFFCSYILLPIVLGYSLGYSNQFYDYNELVNSLLIQIVFFVMFIAGYVLFILKRTKVSLPNIPIRWFSPVLHGKSLKVVLICAILFSGFLFQSFRKGPYGLWQARLILEENDPSLNIYSFLSRFFYAGFSIIIATLYAKRRVVLFFILFFLYFILLAINLTGGTRASLFHGIAVLSMAFWMINGKRLGFYIFSSGILTLMFISPLILDLRQNILASEVSTAEKLKSIYKEVSSPKWEIHEAVASILDRADIVANTAVLHAYLHDYNDYGYFTPYYGAILSFVPRIIFPDKPYPGSIDGSVAGIPSYRLAIIRYNNPLASITTHGALNMYWQFWWFGITIGSLLTGYILAYLIRSFMRGGLWGYGWILVLSEKALFGGGPSLDLLISFIFGVLLPVIFIFMSLNTFKRLLQKRH